MDNFLDLVSQNVIYSKTDTKGIITEASDFFCKLSKYTKEELIGKIMEVLATMPKRDQLIMQLYYFEELTYKEISEVLDITPSRISQVHKRVVSKIKESIG